MDRENLSQFLDNTINTCREQAKNKNMTREETQDMLNNTLMQFYKILAGYTNGTVDNDTHELFVEKCPEFGDYLRNTEEQEKARVEGLRKEREELQRRLAQIDSELGTSRNEIKVETQSTRRTQTEDPCSRGSSRISSIGRGDPCSR